MISSCSSRLGKGTFALLDGTSIAFQEWGNKLSKKKILALHGWLDNSNTHAYLAPYLAERGYHVVAFDYCGHGKSSHLPRGSNYLFQK
jgi:alpha-beta hydrolase superfamily lysophospholipase